MSSSHWHSNKRGLPTIKRKMAENLSSKLTSLSLDDSRTKEGDCSAAEKDCTWEDAFDEHGNTSYDYKDQESKLDTAGGKPKYIYYSMDSKDVTPTPDNKSEKSSTVERYKWVLEAYDFKPSLKTTDIVAGLQKFKSSTYVIKWVDDTHALIIFTTEELAEQALNNSYAIYRLRPLCEGTSLSMQLAKRCADNLRPCQEKPKTTSSVARRMISSALGVKIAVSKDKLEEERKAMQRAKEEKKSASKRKDYWTDDI